MAHDADMVADGCMIQLGKMDFLDQYYMARYYRRAHLMSLDLEKMRIVCDRGDIHWS